MRLFYFRCILFFTFIIFITAVDNNNKECWDVWISSPENDELPLCGNGKLDPGEICDDGNRNGGDGCNAWCSAFDAMTGTCILAGKNAHCPYEKTVISGEPSKTVFCNLLCIDASPNGQYVVMADLGTVIKMNLFTDDVVNSISVFSASITQSFSPICSLAVLEPDNSVVVQECSSQHFSLLSADGSTSTSIANLGSVLQPVFLGNRPTYYNKKLRKILTAGIPSPQTTKNQAATNNNNNNNEGQANIMMMAWCIHLYAMDVPTYANYSTGLFGPLDVSQMSVWARIPCVAYNVVEDTTVYPSFSVKGMQPKAVTLEPCMQMHMPNSMCYVVYMERNDMQFFRAYIPEGGGVDIAYVASTNVMENALGHPIIKYGNSKNSNNNDNMMMTYESVGTCFQARNNIRTPSSPPVISLGNACKNKASLGVGCSTPLNNPFMNDIMSSPYLLAEGLSVTHTHNDLSQIFSSKCTMITMANTSGPMLYKNILESTYANTTPVDFVEIPGIMDIVYITPTSVGLISTKRVTLNDRNYVGYCKATNLIYCPAGFFGDVRYGTCAPCDDKTAQGFGMSVAWQIKCMGAGGGLVKSNRRSLLSAMESAPYEKFSSVVSKDVSENHISSLLCTYLTSKGLPCPSSTSAMTPQQQYNMDADILDSAAASTTTTTTTDSNKKSLVKCLISEAEKKTGKILLKNNAAEYTTTWISAGNDLLTASTIITEAITKKAATNTSSNSSDSQTMIVELSAEEKKLIQSTCRNKMNLQGVVGGWLSCSIPRVANLTNTANNNNTKLGGRRLLAVDNAISAYASLVEQSGLTMVSSTSITW